MTPLKQLKKHLQEKEKELQELGNLIQSDPDHMQAQEGIKAHIRALTRQIEQLTREA